MKRVCLSYPTLKVQTPVNKYWNEFLYDSREILGVSQLAAAKIKMAEMRHLQIW